MGRKKHRNWPKIQFWMSITIRETGRTRAHWTKWHRARLMMNAWVTSLYSRWYMMYTTMATLRTTPSKARAAYWMRNSQYTDLMLDLRIGPSTAPCPPFRWHASRGIVRSPSHTCRAFPSAYRLRRLLRRLHLRQSHRQLHLRRLQCSPPVGRQRSHLRLLLLLLQCLCRGLRPGEAAQQASSLPPGKDKVRFNAINWLHIQCLGCNGYTL